MDKEQETMIKDRPSSITSNLELDVLKDMPHPLGSDEVVLRAIIILCQVYSDEVRCFLSASMW